MVHASIFQSHIDVQKSEQNVHNSEASLFFAKIKFSPQLLIYIKKFCLFVTSFCYVLHSWFQFYDKICLIRFLNSYIVLCILQVTKQNSPVLVFQTIQQILKNNLISEIAQLITTIYINVISHQFQQLIVYAFQDRCKKEVVIFLIVRT